MATFVRNVRVIDPKAGIDSIDDVIISPEEIKLAPTRIDNNIRGIDGKDLILVPGLIDLHVHFRDPGFLYKEDCYSGIHAALHGGVTSALVMPNTSPTLDCPKWLIHQFKSAKKSGFHLMVAAAASKGLLGQKVTDIGVLKQSGASAITDDGKPILRDEHMIEVLRACRRHDLVCMQHAEDTTVSCGHSLHDGEASKRLKVPGQPRAAEVDLVKRDIALAEQIGARYHVLHISCKESLKLIEHAKRRGVRASCEVTPHHLLLADKDIKELNANKKMNPPLRERADQQALLDGINNGVIDAVASDHAPHSRSEKMSSFLKAPFGVVGVETSILVLMTLVAKHKISLTKAIKLMTTGPASVLNDENIGTMFKESCRKNAVLIDPNFRSMMTESHLYGRSKNSAFLGMEVFGRVMATFLNGHLVMNGRGLSWR